MTMINLLGLRTLWTHFETRRERSGLVPEFVYQSPLAETSSE